MPKSPAPEWNAEALAKSARFFAELPDELVRELAKHGRPRSLPKGALLHQRGDAADGLYQVKSGCIRISTLSADGRELLLADLGPGAFFGEISLFDERPRTHDAQALERSELLLVPQAELHALLAAKPQLALHFLRLLATKLRLCFAALEAVTLQSVPQRLAQRLLWLAERAPRTRAGDAALSISVSQTDLARMVGATRQSVNKELQSLQRAGLIEVHGRRTTLVDLAGLHQLAGL